MTNAQLYLAIGVPLVFNTILSVVIYTLLSARLTDLGPRFEALNQRFDDLRDLWRAELRRVEGVLDARLQHLEEHLRERP